MYPILYPTSHPTWHSALYPDLAQVAVLAVVAGLLTIYYKTVYSLPKREYNSVSAVQRCRLVARRV